MGRYIKIDIPGSGIGGIAWIHLGEDGDRWRSVVNAVMNFRVA
jgi:hypothetical protein